VNKSGMTWFRFYSGWRTNPKVKLLHETFQLRFIDLMCLRCEGEIPGATDDELAYHLRIPQDELSTTLSTLEDSGLWADGDICNWDKRQFKSDTSTERVKRFRKQGCNVTVTPSESESDTDTDTEEEQEGARDGLKIRKLTDLFVQLIKANDQQARVPTNTVPWEAQIGRIHFADHRSFEEIEKVIRFSQDGFWAASVLNPRDLAEKFPKILLQTKRDGAATKGPDSRAEANRRVMEKKIKEFKDGASNQSDDGDGCIVQRAIGRGQIGRIPG